MSSTSNVATAPPPAAPVAPHLRAPAARDPQHAADLARWSRIEGLVRAGREACERGERARELRAIREARGELFDLVGWPV